MTSAERRHRCREIWADRDAMVLKASDRLSNLADAFLQHDPGFCTLHLVAVELEVNALARRVGCQQDPDWSPPRLCLEGVLDLLPLLLVLPSVNRVGLREMTWPKGRCLETAPFDLTGTAARAAWPPAE